MGSLTLTVLAGAMVSLLVLSLISAALHAAHMEKRSAGQMLPHEEEAYLLCKGVSGGDGKR